MTVTRVLGTLAAWLFAAILVLGGLSLAIHAAWVDFLDFWLRVAFGGVALVLLPWMLVAAVVRLARRRPPPPSATSTDPLRLPL